MIYNLTNISGSGDPLSFVTNVNALTGGTWAVMILLIGFIVLFVATKSRQSSHAFSASSIITGILGILFAVIGLVPEYILVIASVLAAIGFIMVWFE